MIEDKRAIEFGVEYTAIVDSIIGNSQEFLQFANKVKEEGYALRASFKVEFAKPLVSSDLDAERADQEELAKLVKELEQAFETALAQDTWIFEVTGKLFCLGYRPRFISRSGILLESVPEEERPAPATPAAAPIIPEPTEAEQKELGIKWNE